MNEDNFLKGILFLAMLCLVVMTLSIYVSIQAQHVAEMECLKQGRTMLLINGQKTCAKVTIE
jgi:hypothetical protein